MALFTRYGSRLVGSNSRYKHNDTQSLGACKLPAPAVAYERAASHCRMEQQMACLQVAPVLDAWQRTGAAGWSRAFLCQVATGTPMAAPTIYNLYTGCDDRHAGYRYVHSASMSGCLLATA